MEFNILWIMATKIASPYKHEVPIFHFQQPFFLVLAKTKNSILNVIKSLNRQIGLLTHFRNNVFTLSGTHALH